MRTNTEYILLLIIICASIMFGYHLEHKVLTADKIGCGSDSMGLSFKCDDMVHTEKSFKLEEGDVYIFKNKNGTHVIHRLVKDCRQGCYGLIFKGDNNLYADNVVNESDILYRVTGVVYE